MGAAHSLDALYGELWDDKVRRVRSESPHGRKPGWALLPIISKANDDVRQEVFVMQLIRFFARVFPPSLWLRPYRILSTGPRSGLLEFLPNTQSLHALKRQPGFGALDEHFRRHYGEAGSPAGATARLNFARSLAGYSVVTYLLGIKDLHNGNIQLDREGHLIHIDFGFVLGSAPGGRAALEHRAPFKLTREMVDVLGGPEVIYSTLLNSSLLYSTLLSSTRLDSTRLDSTLFYSTLLCFYLLYSALLCSTLQARLFRYTFVELCTAALREARAHAGTLLSLVEMTGYRSAMSCFAAGVEAPLQQLRERLMLDVPDDQLGARVEALVALSYNNVYTRAYDEFQKWSNGIAH